MQAELREKPAANEGTCDSDEEVADDPEAGALHDLAAGYPAMRPTTNTTRKLSPDICIFVFSRFFGRSDKNPAVFRERESHWLAGSEHCLSRGEARPSCPQGLPPYP